MSEKDFGFGTQIRKSPFFDATVRWGAKGFSVYNHMYIPRDFGNPEENFWNLVNNSILCDVAVERQVEITGPDAFQFIQLLTPRDLSKLALGQCKYVLITNNDGGILNDPVLLRLGENHFWLSLADSDILLWAQGVAVNSNLKVSITEPDVISGASTFIIFPVVIASASICIIPFVGAADVLLRCNNDPAVNDPAINFNPYPSVKPVPSIFNNVPKTCVAA